LIPGNDNSEAVLSDGRQCISAAAGNPTSSIAQQYEKQLPQVKKAMAGVLNDRGVYDGALSLIKESLAVKPDDAYSFHIQSRVLENLGRYSECIASEQAAVRLSDGKYEEYHFTLGNCYFDISDWVHAALSFRNALTLSPKDSNIAFNLALSLLNQGYKSEAQYWFREALTMNPSPDVRAKIISALQR
jgi:tetratricopeptide (TPR) repeat protein